MNVILVVICMLFFSVKIGFTQEAGNIGKYTFELNYEKNKDELSLKYRKDLAEFIKNKATSVEIILLKEVVVGISFSETMVSDKFFYVEAKNVFYSIEEVLLLKDKLEVNLFCEKLNMVMVNGDKDVIFDHKPSFGLRLYSGKDVFFSTSFSNECENWYIMYPTAPVDYDWLSFNKSDFNIWMKKFDRGN